MSKGQTCRSENNAFLPLRSAVKHMEAASQAPKKTLKLNTPCLRSFRFAPAQFLLRDPSSN
jgi:hypothetical protein